MVTINWTEQALADIDSIANYIAYDSIRYAKLTVQRIFQKTELLNVFPEMGRIVPELQNRAIKELIEGSYRIVYKIDANRIDILTVHNSSRLLQNSPIYKSLQ